LITYESINQSINQVPVPQIRAYRRETIPMGLTEPQGKGTEALKWLLQGAHQSLPNLTELPHLRTPPQLIHGREGL